MTSPKIDAGRFVFAKMFTVYGNVWLDKWRTGVLDAQGNDEGALGSMREWTKALEPFSKDRILTACERVRDPAYRPKFYGVPPSLGEFVELCKSVRPPDAPRLENTIDRTGQIAGRAKLAAIKRQLKGQTDDQESRHEDGVAH